MNPWVRIVLMVSFWCVLIGVVLVFLGTVTGCAPYDFNEAEYFPQDLSAAGSCAFYGVDERHESMGEIVKAEGVAEDLIQELCEELAVADHYLGCALPQADGTVALYWRAGDLYIENHERCHARHGRHHNGVRM
jgi:hypothetical protein